MIEKQSIDTTETTVETQPDEEPSEPEDNSKYQLLNRLFRLLASDKKPVNPVLAGYFGKLMLLLLQRK